MRTCNKLTGLYTALLIIFFASWIDSADIKNPIQLPDRVVVSNDIQAIRIPHKTSRKYTTHRYKYDEMLINRCYKLKKFNKLKRI